MGGMDWIDLAQGDKWWAPVNAFFGFHKMWKIF
jgi:hypothetical protein